MYRYSQRKSKRKQIVGGSLQDQGDRAQEDSVAEQDAPFCTALSVPGDSGRASLLLNPATSPYYEATRRQAIEALKAYPGGMQSVATPKQCREFSDAVAAVGSLLLMYLRME